MNLKKALIAGGLVLVLICAIPATIVLGAEPTPPTELEKIVGPTMWAVGVANCAAGVSTLRIKKIEGCDVDTDPLSGAITACPNSEAEILYYRFQAGTVFGLPCEAIITKVKNFKAKDPVFSFDAQIQFIVGINDPDECTSSPQP